MNSHTEASVVLGAGHDPCQKCKISSNTTPNVLITVDLVSCFDNTMSKNIQMIRCSKQWRTYQSTGLNAGMFSTERKLNEKADLRIGGSLK